MREVLFRGKSLRYGKWVYGSYIQITEPAGSVYHSIFHPRDGVTEGDEPVDPETVGQWTGLTDRNGVRIFEGDICRLACGEGSWTAAVEFGNPNGSYSWGWQLWRISGPPVNPDILLWVDTPEASCEVIGNIHDNPGLTEVET